MRLCPPTKQSGGVGAASADFSDKLLSMELPLALHSLVLGAKLAGRAPTPGDSAAWEPPLLSFAPETSLNSFRLMSLHQNLAFLAERLPNCCLMPSPQPMRAGR